MSTFQLTLLFKSNELFEFLKKSKHTAYRSIVNGDQSWFLYQYYHKGKWCVESEKKKTEFEDDQTIHHKVMITIIRRFSKGYIIDYLNSGISYNSSFFKENILDTLIEKKNKIWPNSSDKKKIGYVLIIEGYIIVY